jgi:ribose 5-phosphate isomerase B
MRFAFACDHAAFEQRGLILAALREAGHEVLDFGTKTSEPVDYPDFVGPAAEAVGAGQADRAVVMCGTGVGASIVANKVRGVRCALATDEETAEMSRRHNDANALALGGRTRSAEQNLKILARWMETPFDGGRHIARLEKIQRREERSISAVPSRRSR